jgi:hypothetical protein
MQVLTSASSLPKPLWCPESLVFPAFVRNKAVPSGAALLRLEPSIESRSAREKKHGALHRSEMRIAATYLRRISDVSLPDVSLPIGLMIMFYTGSRPVPVLFSGAFLFLFANVLMIAKAKKKP